MNRPHDQTIDKALSQRFGLKPVLSLLALFLLGLIAALGLRMVDRNPGHQLTSPPGLGVSFAANHGPFYQGTRSTLTGAQASIAYPIYRPDDSAASDASMTAVWIEQTSGPDGISHVALEYSSGLEVIVQPMDVPDAKAFFQTMANQIGLPNAVQSVEGVPALVIPQNSSVDATKSNAGSVTFIKQGVEVAIYGHVPVDELLRVANTVN